MYHTRCICLLLFMLVLTACESTPIATTTCTSFVALQSEIGEVFATDEFAKWIRKQYSLRKSAEIEVKNYSSFDANFLWQTDGYEYSATIEGGKFARLTIKKAGAKKLYTGDIMTCFGSPEFYRALHGLAIDAGDYQELDLFFPSMGVVVHGYRHYFSDSHSTLPIQDNSPIMHMIVLQPGTVGEMLEQIYGTVTPFEYGAIRAWPSSWEDIVIDITPEIQQLQNTP